jgi:hypothetical protein
MGFFLGRGKTWGMGVAPLRFWGFSQKRFSLPMTTQDFSEKNRVNAIIAAAHY